MCIAPLHGWRARRADPKTHRRKVVFNLHEGFGDMPLSVPCGQCWECRLKRSREWAIRCMHEASLHERNSFLTLTYAEEYLPEGATLVKKHFQDFMKRLRERIKPQKVKFYHAGEYGSQFQRPHYHAILFGYDFPDKLPVQMRNGFPVWESTMLRELWTYGRSEIGSVTFQSAAYVARYVMKKLTGKAAEDAYISVDGETGEMWRRLPEYSTMSKGIGKGWYEKYGPEVYREDSVLLNKQLVRPPRFYDKQFELTDPVRLAVLKAKRVEAALAHPEERSAQRLAQKEACKFSRLEKLKRSIE